MRFFAILALTLLGIGWAADSAYADRPRLQGSNVYIYPDGTVGYFVGPGGYRSGYYVVPSVSNGSLGPNYNSYSGYNNYPAANNYNGQSSYYGDYRWRRPINRPYWGWDR